MAALAGNPINAETITVVAANVSFVIILFTP
jgi:hypothetical protein